MPRERDQVRRARELRRAMTPAEVILWRALRGRRYAGFKFRRQRPIGRYLADFYCHDSKLIVELDGETHIGREEADQSRQRALEGWGYKVLRFWNPDIYDDFECVMEAIFEECQRRAKRLYPSPNDGRAGE
jgi:very-short-patch-repair endonuclease